ncbi:Pentatricopeptide repeat-containing protein, mitochondrial [Sesbania bispinosa]|nr:Pentatricopeptide repeat-containing protein, mitochondrial [Sesbania bispinosa]
MPFEPDASIWSWSALLTACILQGKNKMSQYVSKQLFELEHQIAVPYVVMTNIYASAEMWDGVSAIRRKVKYLQLRKSPGQSIVQVNGKGNLLYLQLKIHIPLNGLTSHSKQGLVIS